jgi:hypothetical protein
MSAFVPSGYWMELDHGTKFRTHHFSGSSLRSYLATIGADAVNARGRVCVDARKVLQRVLSNTAVFDTLSQLSGDFRQPTREEDSVYAAIRQGKAKTGMAEELTRRIKEGAIPIISDVPGFMAYYVVYAPDDTVMAISIFNDYAGAEESNRRALTWSCAPAYRASYSVGRAGDRAHPGVARE